MAFLNRIFLGLALFCPSLMPSVATAENPNVLFIVCDDLNTRVSTSGYPYISTPAFDELADAGMTFRRAYCQYPVCGPSRASFLHGLYGPTGLKDEQHKDGKNARQIVAWLESKVHGDKPFFIVCGIQKPHVPFLAPDKYFAMYPKADLQVTPASLEFWKTVPKIAQTNRHEGFGFEFCIENDGLRREYIQAYHACISFLDAQIGIVLDAVKRSGQPRTLYLVQSVLQIF